MPRTVAFDTETFYIKPTQANPGYSVAQLGNWRYCHDERFDPYLLSVNDGEETWVGQPKDFNWNALEGAELISHNAAFDSAVYEAMVEKGLAPRIKFGRWDCSANLTSFVCNRRALATATEHLLGVRVSKEMRDWMNGKHWEDAVAAGKAPALSQYAADDVVHCRNIWQKYSPHWTELERGLSDLTIRQCRRGVAIDVERLQRYRGVLGETLIKIEATLPWVKEGATQTSSKAIATQCRKEGIPSPPIKARDGGEEAFIEWERRFAPQFSWVANVGLWRSVNKIATTLDTIFERLRPDKTIDFSLLYFGAHTGRWSGGGAGLNMQNLRKDPLYVRDDYSIVIDEDELAAIDKMRRAGGAWEKEYLIREAIDVRSLFIARPGHKFVIADLAQIEPRVLAWLCGNFELLDRLKDGMSIYEAHARDTMGWTGGELKGENPLLYKLAKARVLGLGYGCGKVKFKAVAKTLAGLDITDEDSAKTVADFRESNPKICGLWETLDHTFRRSSQSVFEMELPSGRTMRYETVGPDSRTYVDAEGKLCWKTVYCADIGGTRKIFYGGKLAENLTQAVARDVFGEHLLALDRAGIAPVFSVHDESVNEVPLDFPAEEVTRIMSQTPEWLPGCPIAAEAVEASHYKK